MAHIWPIHDLHWAHVASRSAINSAIRSAQDTDHQDTLARQKGVSSVAPQYCMFNHHVDKYAGDGGKKG